MAALLMPPPLSPSATTRGQFVNLDLVDTLRSTGAVRQFRRDPVADDVLARLLDTARFAPSGGNRQGWHVIVVKDPDARAALRDIYLSGWYQYLAIVSAGLVPWAPVTDREAEVAAVADAAHFAQAGAAAPGFAATLDTAPVLLLVLADLSVLAEVGPRPAALHPGRWRLHLPLRVEPAPHRPRRRPGWCDDDDAGAPRRRRPALFAVPDTVAVASLVVLGPRVGLPPVEAGAGRSVLLGRHL